MTSNIGEKRLRSPSPDYNFRGAVQVARAQSPQSPPPAFARALPPAPFNPTADPDFQRILQAVKRDVPVTDHLLAALTEPEQPGAIGAPAPQTDLQKTVNELISFMNREPAVNLDNPSLSRMLSDHLLPPLAEPAAAAQAAFHAPAQPTAQAEAPFVNLDYPFLSGALSDHLLPPLAEPAAAAQAANAPALQPAAQAEAPFVNLDYPFLPRMLSRNSLPPLVKPAAAAQAAPTAQIDFQACLQPICDELREYAKNGGESYVEALGVRYYAMPRRRNASIIELQNNLYAAMGRVQIWERNPTASTELLNDFPYKAFLTPWQTLDVITRAIVKGINKNISFTDPRDHRYQVQSNTLRERGKLTVHPEVDTQLITEKEAKRKLLRKAKRQQAAAQPA